MKTSKFENNFLDLYLEKYLSQNNSEVNIETIISQFVTFLLAGVDTTAGLVSNCCYHLCKDIEL